MTDLMNTPVEETEEQELLAEATSMLQCTIKATSSMVVNFKYNEYIHFLKTNQAVVNRLLDNEFTFNISEFFNLYEDFNNKMKRELGMVFVEEVYKINNGLVD